MEYNYFAIVIAITAEVFNDNQRECPMQGIHPVGLIAKG
jgi:hypothetical protein